jgi:hypothetical protein
MAHDVSSAGGTIAVPKIVQFVPTRAEIRTPQCRYTCTKLDMDMGKDASCAAIKANGVRCSEQEHFSTLFLSVVPSFPTL